MNGSEAGFAYVHLIFIMNQPLDHPTLFQKKSWIKVIIEVKNMLQQPQYFLTA